MDVMQAPEESFDEKVAFTVKSLRLYKDWLEKGRPADNGLIDRLGTAANQIEILCSALTAAKERAEKAEGDLILYTAMYEGETIENDRQRKQLQYAWYTIQELEARAKTMREAP